ncbi:DNA polymerase IV [Actinopolymorpha sp. B17G11]|uniref:DNA polymerase IV n=1 Tax=Actinopolymorpha sp. B17G11 TaxID=3160861 RepID=UPI0032E4B14E
MRTEPSVLHLDLDAFFAAVEQRDKPSLRGKPVIVGGLGPRGVVATASYEARAFGVRSAMRMAEARSRCPHAAFLSGRFAAYRLTSRAVLAVLREVSPLVEPVSFDEAYVDLAAAGQTDLSAADVEDLGRELKARVSETSGGVTASIGAGSSKLIAKIASDLDKPDGLVVVPPGTESALLRPMPVSRIPGVGPATNERLRRIGVHTVGELARVPENELVSLLGKAHGQSLSRLARAQDDRPVVAERESKSISVEDTFDRDIADLALLAVIVDRLATRVCERLVGEGLSGRTVTVKIRLFDFTTHTRSATVAGPTDDRRTVTALARRLLQEVDTSAGVRLLGVGVSGLADWAQQDLFSSRDDALPQDATSAGTAGAEWGQADMTEPPAGAGQASEAGQASGRKTDVSTDAGGPHAGDATQEPGARRWMPGADAVHASYGRGWVWGAGLGRVTVRFETATTTPGVVRTLAADDPDLAPYTPLTWSD